MICFNLNIQTTQALTKTNTREHRSDSLPREEHSSPPTAAASSLLLLMRDALLSRISSRKLHHDRLDSRRPCVSLTHHGGRRWAVVEEGLSLTRQTGVSLSASGPRRGGHTASDL